MLGNAWQWTADCRNDSYAGAPADGSARANGDCASRVVRGGSWNNLPRFVRAATRDFYAADFRVANTGFRVARAVP
jgi:formylglycine-generating enzyme required for sulfatase activity